MKIIMRVVITISLTICDLVSSSRTCSQLIILVTRLGRLFIFRQVVAGCLLMGMSRIRHGASISLTRVKVTSSPRLMSLMQGKQHMTLYYDYILRLYTVTLCYDFIL